MTYYTKKELYDWCRVPACELEHHPNLKLPLRICLDSQEMGEIMACELVDEIQSHNQRGEPTRAILPCGPLVWYKPFTDLVNRKQVSLRNLFVFHMDECLDWQGKPLPKDHPFNFRTYMETHFYDPVQPALQVPEENRFWLNADNIPAIQYKLENTSIDITYGGWGQDGHLAFNQARRNSLSPVKVDEIRNSTVRIQENGFDTVLALAQRTLGCAYQFIPPMSVTLGIREILRSKKIRLFSDTGSWKQTALRMALFGPITPEYPMTVLQEHSDVLLTATRDTANHPFSEHPEWDFGV